MAKDIPFNDDVMTLIMGLGGPEEPGQHGRTKAPMPDKDAVGVITQIRDLCEDFLSNAGKGDDEGPEKPVRGSEGKEGKETDTEEEE